MKKCYPVSPYSSLKLMKRLIIIFLLLNFSAMAEVVISEGKYIYSGNMSENEGCTLLNREQN